MNLKVLKLTGLGLTVVGGVIGVLTGIVDQKTMSAEVAKQIAEALGKK